MPSRRSLVLLGAFAVLAVARVGLADPPCLGDVQKFCKDVPATAGKIQACLQAHESGLSKGCKEHVATLRKQVQQLAAICVWDIERFCPDVPPGGGKIVACLKKNEDSLSPICKEQFGNASD